MAKHSLKVFGCWLSSSLQSPLRSLPVFLTGFKIIYKKKEKIDNKAVMPTYAYHCAGCSHEMESLQKITAKPLTCCPRCGENKLVRGPGGGAGLLFLGSGFYCTDYQTGAQKTAGKSENLSQTPSSSGNGCSHSGCGCIGKNK